MRTSSKGGERERRREKAMASKGTKSRKQKKTVK